MSRHDPRMVAVGEYLPFIARGFRRRGPTAPRAAARLAVCAEVICDIGDRVASHRVEPAKSVVTEPGRHGAWLLRNPQSPPALRWPRNLLNAGAEPPGLIIDPQLQGTCDVYAIVRAVDAGGAARPQPSFATVLKVARALRVRLNARVA